VRVLRKAVQLSVHREAPGKLREEEREGTREREEENRQKMIMSDSPTQYFS
jgi:hypothetical protein